MKRLTEIEQLDQLFDITETYLRRLALRADAQVAVRPHGELKYTRVNNVWGLYVELLPQSETAEAVVVPLRDASDEVKIEAANLIPALVDLAKTYHSGAMFGHFSQVQGLARWLAEEVHETLGGGPNPDSYVGRRVQAVEDILDRSGNVLAYAGAQGIVVSAPEPGRVTIHWDHGQVSGWLRPTRKHEIHILPTVERFGEKREPEEALPVREGQKVRAIARIYDLPGEPDPGPIHAEPGDVGVVVHAQKGLWPTVRFERTGTASCVTNLEVMPTGDDDDSA